MKTVLFVCVKNGGKSQMASSVMRKVAGDRIKVLSGGTEPGKVLNTESVQALETRGYSTHGEFPKAIDPQSLENCTAIVVVGKEAQLDAPAGVRIERWDTVEPSHQGIEGAERMNLILDDIESRVNQLAESLI